MTVNQYFISLGALWNKLSNLDYQLTRPDGLSHSLLEQRQNKNDSIQSKKFQF